MVIIGIFVLVNLCACAPAETCVRVGEMNFPPERIGLAVEQQIAAMYEPGTDEIYTRQGISAIRRVDSAFDHVNEDVPCGAVNIGTQFRAGGSEAPDYARINAMMPESVFTYTTTFKVTENWSGLQTLRLEITGVYAPMNAAALFGFTDEQNARMSPGSLLYVDFENRTVSAAMKDGSTPDIDIQEEDIRRTFEVPVPVGPEVNTSEIAADYRLFEQDGQQYLTASFSQTGDTAQNASTGNIRFIAYVDDDVSVYHAYIQEPYDRTCKSGRDRSGINVHRRPSGETAPARCGR